MSILRTKPKVRIWPVRSTFSFRGTVFSLHIHSNHIVPIIRHKSNSTVDHRDDLQHRLNLYLESKPIFTNAYQSYKTACLHYNTSENEISSFEPIRNFQELTRNNKQSCPSVGSLVEFLDPHTNFTGFGVVVRNAQSRFNEGYNKVLVLTINNTIETVSPTYINFHMHRVLDPDWIESLQVIENRENQDFKPRHALVEVAKLFISQSLDLSTEIEPSLKMVHSQYAKPHNMIPISVLEIIESIKFSDEQLRRINESYFQQSVLLMAVHMNMSKSPIWISSSNLPYFRQTNIVENNCSNNLAYGCDYFVNSMVNTQAIEKFLANCNNKVLMDELNEWLNTLHKEQKYYPKSYDDLNFYLNIWDGRNYKYFIDILKFVMVYPHPSLMQELQSKVDIFKNSPLTPSNVLEFLEELKLYNNKSNQITDMYLSSNIMGRSQLSELAVASASEIDPLIPSESIQSSNLIDKFPHLRKAKNYYRDHVIYGIPLAGTPKNTSGSFLGISLEKINSRKYNINIHIPDIMTKVSPSSELFSQIISSSINLKSMSKLIGGSILNNHFDEKILDQLRFPNRNIEEEESDFIQVGDLALEKTGTKRMNKPRDNITCMTISFVYNTFDANPFSKLEEKISISFDSISNVRIKNLDWDAFEEALEDKSEILPFRIFRRRPSVTEQKKNEIKMNPTDIHNVGFIYNALKSHFKVRNLGGATTTNPTVTLESSDATNLKKELSYVNEDSKDEKLITKVDSVREEQYPKSRFFVNEVVNLAGRITSNFCSKHQIPIFTHFQDIIESESSESLKDEVLVSHNNMLLPPFHVNSFEQTLISRDSDGYVSVSANLISRNYLNKSHLDVFSDARSRNLPLGISNGFVKICDVMNDFEVMFNQLQILNFVQLQTHNSFIKQTDNHLDFIKGFSYLKGYGYNLNGPYNSQVLQFQLDKISNSRILLSYLQSRNKRFWTLEMLDQKLLEDSFAIGSGSMTGISYECTITHVGYTVDSLQKRISRGFCKELSIEVDILNDIDTDINIGSVVKCDKVLASDAVSGICILKDDRVFD